MAEHSNTPDLVYRSVSRSARPLILCGRHCHREGATRPVASADTMHRLDSAPLVDHLIGMNRVFTAWLADEPAPRRPAAGHVESDPVGTYRETAATLLLAFASPGVIEREYRGPLGSATGADRLQIRQYDLLAHGWDLAQATGQPADLPDDLAELSLAFARAQLTEEYRPGRFAPAQAVDERTPAIGRLAAFLGRPVSTAG